MLLTEIQKTLQDNDFNVNGPAPSVHKDQCSYISIDIFQNIAIEIHEMYPENNGFEFVLIAKTNHNLLNPVTASFQNQNSFVCSDKVSREYILNILVSWKNMRESDLIDIIKKENLHKKYSK